MKQSISLAHNGYDSLGFDNNRLFYSVLTTFVSFLPFTTAESMIIRLLGIKHCIANW
jgi:hypothetical protein